MITAGEEVGIVGTRASASAPTCSLACYRLAERWTRRHSWVRRCALEWLVNRHLPGFWTLVGSSRLHDTI
jgi:hypothetical protein